MHASEDRSCEPDLAPENAKNSLLLAPRNATGGSTVLPATRVGTRCQPLV